MNSEQIEDLIRAITSVAHGDVYRATGLELVAQAISGRGDRDLASAVSEVADAIRDAAIALSDIAEAIDRHGDKAGKR